MTDFSDTPATITPDDAFAKISGATATYSEISYGRLNYQLSPVKHWYRMSQPSTSYNFSTYATHKAYISEAMQLAAADVNFSSSESVVVLTNPDATAFPAGPTFVVYPGSGITANGHEFLNAITSGHDLNTWNSIWLNHEGGHSLGLVDLYAYQKTDPSKPWSDSCA